MIHLMSEGAAATLLQSLKQLASGQVQVEGASSSLAAGTGAMLPAQDAQPLGLHTVLAVAPRVIPWSLAALLWQFGWLAWSAVPVAGMRLQTLQWQQAWLLPI